MARKRRRRRSRQSIKLKIKAATLHSVVALLLIGLGALVMVSFSGQGELLSFINQYLIWQMGAGMLFLPFIFISAGMVMFRTPWAWSKPHVLLGAILLMLTSMSLFRQGLVGQDTFKNLSALITPYGAVTILTIVMIIGLLIMVQLSIGEVLSLLAKLLPKGKARSDQLTASGSQSTKGKGFSWPMFGLPFGRKSRLDFNVNDASDQTVVPEKEDPGTAVESEAQPPEVPMPAATPKSGELSDESESTGENAPIIWDYPPLSLLSKKIGGKADRGDVKASADIIENTLDSFGIRAKVVEVNFGPSVTQYALEITRGTKLSRITNLATDLALALAAPTGQVRIEAPIAGRSLVGIEVPNHSAQYVTLRTMLSSDKMKKMKSKLAVALGINVSGNPVFTDISSMPHMLIAGATGSGKSVAINAFLCSMLFRASPAEVKLILVDPKRVELTGYNGIPHLLTPVIVDPPKVVSALKWATKEMERRYKQLAEVGVKNIDSYNELAGFAAMPNIVIVIDELADIMLFAPSEVEDAITRIAQMARAVGMHLVLATQRPSVDVITGLIKANIPARIAFNVSSMMDSRVILDQPGAEKLLGRGDMLFIPPTQAKPTRVQGTYVSEAETKALIDYLKSQGHDPKYQEEITTKYKATRIGIESGEERAGADRDQLFSQSARLIAQYDKASSSMIQRRLSVGYARAARILDQLYEAGLVSPPEGSKPREVFTAKVAEYLGSIRSLEE